MIAVGFDFAGKSAQHEAWRALLDTIFQEFAARRAPKIYKDENGKPRADGAAFSVSHSGDIVMCAAFIEGDGASLPAIADGDRIALDGPERFFRIPCDKCDEIGADVEIVSDDRAEARLLAIAGRYFTPGEVDLVKRGGKDEFYRLWTMKESFLKKSGVGLRGIRAVDTLDLPPECAMTSFKISRGEQIFRAAVCFEKAR